jgi:DNA-binding LytR/AlgR family response regulator
LWNKQQQDDKIMGIDYSKQIGKKITTKGTQKICIDIESIMYIQSNNGLAKIFLFDKTEVLDIKTLKTFEEELTDMGFCRISKDTLINSKYITKVSSNAKKRMVYLREITLNVARRRFNLLKKNLYLPWFISSSPTIF